MFNVILKGDGFRPTIEKEYASFVDAYYAAKAAYESGQHGRVYIENEVVILRWGDRPRWPGDDSPRPKIRVRHNSNPKSAARAIATRRQKTRRAIKWLAQRPGWRWPSTTVTALPAPEPTTAPEATHQDPVVEISCPPPLDPAELDRMLEELLAEEPPTPL